MIKYKIFGLNVESDFKLNCYENQFDKADITIKCVNKYDHVVSKQQFEFISPSEYLFSVPDVANYRILNGSVIEVMPLTDVNDRIIHLFLLGSSFGALLIQRNDFPLHGAVVEKNGVGIAIIGDSGAGKSTLAATLSMKGWKIVTDDVIRTNICNNDLICFSSYPSQKLWETTANELKIDISGAENVNNRVDKYYIENHDAFQSDFVKIDHIIELSKHDNEIHIDQIKKSEILSLLIRNSYRMNIVNVVNKSVDHFKAIAKLCTIPSYWRMKRPSLGFSLEDQVKMINHIIGESK